jgi:hypothetical protein
VVAEYRVDGLIGRAGRERIKQRLNNVVGIPYRREKLPAVLARSNPFRPGQLR